MSGIKAFFQRLIVPHLFRDSARELSNLRVLVFCAMLLALVLVLKMVGFSNDYVKMGLNAIPSNIAYYILGPVSGIFFGVASDLLGTVVKGQTPNLLITAVAALNGFLVGLILYGHPVKLWRVILAVVLKALICSILLNTLVLVISYNYNFQALIVSRLIKNAVEVPLTIVVYYIIAKTLERIGLFRKLKADPRRVQRA